MKNVFLPAFGLALLSMLACSPTRQLSGNDQKITVTFVQVNDVYEIAPLSGGREGGVARVAQLKKQYKQANPNTFLVIAGDFLSPSVYNSLQYNGKAIRGKQMVESLNAAGLDFAVFGNHEFDIRESELQERLNESQFQWISANAFHKQGGRVIPFVKNGQPVPATYILQVTDADGTSARIGIINAILPFNKADYVHYEDPIATAKLHYNALKDSVDAVVAFTHLQMEEDERLAAELPGLGFIIGGHEHDMRFKKVGKVPISKAHANAKSAYVIDFTINQKKGSYRARPKLVTIDTTIALDSATNRVVEKWTGIAERNYSSLGFNARRTVMVKGEPLEGREVPVRRESTNLTRLIVRSMQGAAPGAEVVLLNGGSIRVDDVLTLPVTEYDILRTLPFGGGIREADIKGSLLIKVLEAGIKNRGSGGFLHYNESLAKVSGTWQLGGKAVDPARTYRVAMSEFLFTGKEANLEFLHPQSPDVVKAYEPATAQSDARSDVRLAVIRYLEKQ